MTSSTASNLPNRLEGHSTAQQLSTRCGASSGGGWALCAQAGIKIFRSEPFKDEAQTDLFKDPVPTAL